MQLYDTLSKQKKKLPNPKDKTLRLFVCGPTVYDLSHVGHARTYVAFDMFVKYLRYKKYKVYYLQNITDVADEIIKRANEANASTEEIASKFETQYLKDMDALGITAVDKYARASDYIKEMIQQIQLLQKGGYAYKTPNGVYFRVKNFKDYGKLSGQNLQKLQTAVNIEDDQDKEDPRDFALWKTSSPASGTREPKWNSPWGEGRPGWHIEDTAITEKEFKNAQYEIHGGARDLIFPHHEAEIAQMESAYNTKPMVSFWMHTGFLQIKGEKMSKSLKNFITIQDILKNHSSQTLRMFFTTKHYRSPIDYTRKGLLEATTNEKRLSEFLSSLERFDDDSKKVGDKKISLHTNNFWKYLDDDFNTPRAFAELFQLMSFVYKQNSISRKMKKELLSFFGDVNSIFNIINQNKFKDSKKISSRILELAQKREKLRKEKKWKEADNVRVEIEAQGYELKDTKQGYQIKKVK